MGMMPATIMRNTVVVSTGAWLLVKLEPVLQLSPLTLQVIIIVGYLTAIGCGLNAIAQMDVKRYLSYSVSAYMGLIFIAAGHRTNENRFSAYSLHPIVMSLFVHGGGQHHLE
jgi:NAD(P)H-quinone oxidoreductase subunit 5